MKAMKAKILSLLAVALLAGPMVAHAAYTYTFFSASDSSFALSFTTPDFITTAGVLAGTPVTAGGVTFTQARANLFSGGICFEFGDANAVLLGDGQCGFGSSIVGLGFAPIFIPIPTSIGSYTALGVAGVGRLPFANRLAIAAVPEPGTLALLGLGLAGLGVSRRRKAN